MEAQNDLKGGFGSETDGIETISPEDDAAKQVILSIVIRREMEDASIQLRGSNAELKAGILTWISELAEAAGQSFGDLLQELAFVGMLSEQ